MLKVNKKGKSVLQWDKVIDSTNKESFGSGSMRDSQDGKGRYDLIPTGPIHRLAQHYETGAKKYAERNWEKGQPLSQYYNSAIRHLQALRDADLSEDHAAAAVWNIVAIMHHVDAMLIGTLPESLDSFGIVQAVKTSVETQQTIYQVKEAFSNPKFKPVIRPLSDDGKVHYLASGVMADFHDPYTPLRSYTNNYTDDTTIGGVTVAYQDKNKERPSMQRHARTVKLDPEELG